MLRNIAIRARGDVLENGAFLVDPRPPKENRECWTCENEAEDIDCRLVVDSTPALTPALARTATLTTSIAAGSITWKASSGLP